MIVLIQKWRGGVLALWLVVLSLTGLVGMQTLHAAEHTVVIEGFQFVPEQLTVKPGDTIKWVNRDIAPHTATAKNRSWNTETLKLGESKTIAVTKDMVTDYFCKFHPSMKAKLVIDPN